MRSSAILVFLLSAVLSHCTLLAGPYPDWERCPRSFRDTGSDPAKWTQYHHLDHLNYYNQTIIFDLPLYNAIDGADTQFNLRACAVNSPLAVASREAVSPSDVKIESTKIRLVSWGLEDNATVGEVSSAAHNLQSFMEGSEQSEPVFMLAKSSNTVVGVYISSQVERQSTAEIIQSFINSIGNLDSLPQHGDPSISERALLTERATCKYVLAGAGDRCWALAQKCGITQAKLESFNKAGLCTSVIHVGQTVCCASGTLPDFSPKPGADGFCATYTVKAGDLCSTIASAHYMTVDLIKQYNTNTWGWAGNSNLQLGMKIYLSTGKQPFPAAVQGNVCGPQVPGTTRPTLDSAIWANLNICPLNACYNIWGQCRITPEFCTKTTSETGNPGTAQIRTNRCISNCGTAIINNTDSPSAFHQLGYFEAWNLERPCLYMDVSKLQNSKYNIIHFAFANITADFKIDISHIKEQFDDFTKLTGLSRVLSFRGWTFSTAVDTYAIFRSSITDTNQDAFANTVVSFAEIAEVVDYIVYITYNLHGQWDFNNPYTNPGCPTGNCLRSHINMTKTLYAMSMITKAGVPAAKVYPGYATYGRSFQINQVGCHGPDCTFSAAGATPGPCTETYVSYYEIEHIIGSAENKNYDGAELIQYEEERSDILIYNNDQWVSYLKSDKYYKRIVDYVLQGFGRITTWAADLETSYADEGRGDDLDSLYPLDTPVCDFSVEFATLEDLQASAPNHAPEYNSLYALRTLMGLFDQAYTNYTDTNNGYDTKFEAYKRYIKDFAPLCLTPPTPTPNTPVPDFDCVYDNYVNEPIHQRYNRFSPEQIYKGTWKMTITLVQSQRTQFKTQILNKTGIDPTWITLTGKSEVKKIGEKQKKIEEKKHQNLIINIIGAILCVVSFINEAGLLAAGATNLAQMAAIAGEVASTAFGVYEMVDDPSSALMGLIGMLVGAGGVAVAFRDADNFAKIAMLRRELTAGNRAAAFRDIFKQNDDILQVITKGCR
ncbi:hypothetical protein FE257_013075 [Aspergillus nanangensis]|uniref:chitinase n=1 Tax=Aspergillus nanangensis TaxID=2582783 RepID=A0AAD4CFC1_ASPNN|nr:hypothetical protein FE257_013075 [Aspergillus nanangensis]